MSNMLKTQQKSVVATNALLSTLYGGHDRRVELMGQKAVDNVAAYLNGEKQLNGLIKGYVCQYLKARDTGDQASQAKATDLLCATLHTIWEEQSKAKIMTAFEQAKALNAKTLDEKGKQLPSLTFAEWQKSGVNGHQRRAFESQNSPTMRAVKGLMRAEFSRAGYSSSLTLTAENLTITVTELTVTELAKDNRDGMVSLEAIHRIEAKAEEAKAKAKEAEERKAKAEKEQREAEEAKAKAEQEAAESEAAAKRAEDEAAEAKKAEEAAKAKEAEAQQGKEAAEQDKAEAEQNTADLKAEAAELSEQTKAEQEATAKAEQEATAKAEEAEKARKAKSEAERLSREKAEDADKIAEDLAKHLAALPDHQLQNVIGKLDNLIHERLIEAVACAMVDGCRDLAQQVRIAENEAEAARKNGGNVKQTRANATKVRKAYTAKVGSFENALTAVNTH